ncbi:radical SAM protein [Candidatus Parcubacteria bacterium]|jgi:anaerobic magnesium-protoporphyrin IX monomethyl ester cyclase|nr:radical SAM protein [Candidatus Parcubacteria bacterium]
MKILLLQPIVPVEILWGEYVKGEGFVPPIGLICIGGYLKEKNYEVKIKDSQVDKMTEEDLVKYLEENQFDVIGIPTFTNSVSFSYNTAKICKRVLPNCKIIFGGVHGTIMPERTLKECPEADFIVLREGEYRLEALLKYFKGEIDDLKAIEGIAYRQDGKTIVQPAEKLVDIDELPLPAYDLLDMSKYVPHPTQYKVLPNYPLVIQRGCPYNCAFCDAWAVHGRQIRHRSVDNVMKELTLLKEKYNAKGVYFQDSTFLINKVYIKELLNRMIDEKLNLTWACNTRVNTVDREILDLMKKAGCWMVVYGIESGNQKSLDLMRKRVTVEQNEEAVRITEDAGLVACCSYILALPGEDYDDAMNTINFSLKLKGTVGMFYLPVPYPGTDLIDICKEHGGLREDVKWEDYSAVDFSNPVYINPLIGKEKMQKLLGLAMRKYYTSPIIIWKNLKTIQNFTDVKRYFKAFRALFNI